MLGEIYLDPRDIMSGRLFGVPTVPGAPTAAQVASAVEHVRTYGLGGERGMRA